MNHDFRQHVTSQAFVLVLSRPMIDLLSLIARQRTEDNPAYEHLNAFYAIKRRGLVDTRNGSQGRKVYLTEEGLIVLDLCRRANLVVQTKVVSIQAVYGSGPKPRRGRACA